MKMIPSVSTRHALRMGRVLFAVLIAALVSAGTLSTVLASPLKVGEIIISPSPYDFGGVVTGGSSSFVTFTVTNTGTTIQQLGTIYPEAGLSTSFGWAGDECSGRWLDTGGSCTLYMFFVATGSPGTRSDNILIRDNASVTLATLPVSGTVLPAFPATIGLSSATQIGVSGATGGEVAGQQLSISGNTLLSVGTGAAYVFVKSGSTWTQQAKLSTPDTAFFTTAALDGDTALVGSPFNSAQKGAVFVFTRSGTTWTQQAVLTPPVMGLFGMSLDLEGDTALVGAPSGGAGSAYIFTRSGSTWTQQAQLVSSDPASGDQFGYSVALNGNTALVGAYGKNLNTGSAYIYTRSGTTWTQQLKLTDPAGAAGDRFGSRVELDGTTALVTTNKPSGAGTVFVYTGSGSSWAKQADLVASDSAPGNGFGAALSLIGDSALIGSQDVSGYGTKSMAYFFTRTGSTWTQRAQLVPPPGSFYRSMYGEGVALGSVAAVGAPFETVGGKASAGAIYVYGFPTAGLSATSHDFGSVAAGSSSSSYTVTVTNTGTFDLHIGTLGLGGSNAGDFALGTDTCSGQTVGVGNSCTFGVTFSPSSAGAKSAAVSIPGDAPGSPASISLSGTAPQTGPTFTVNTTADSDGACDIAPGDCSLREAISAANAHAGADTINFSFPTSDQTIRPATPLPNVTGPTTITAGHCGQGIYPGATLDGTNAGSGANGLVLSGGGSTVFGLSFRNFTTGSGVLITSSGNTVTCNVIGSDINDGATPNKYGVTVNNGANNVIGRTDGGYGGNAIDGNSTYGVWVTGAGATGNQIASNEIGYNAFSALANGVGVRVDGGASGNTIGGTAPGFYISNNIANNRGNGIELAADGNVVEGNKIGITMMGNAAGNGWSTYGSGVAISGSNNTIGGSTDAARNIISDNYNGVVITSGTNNLIQGNYIGLNGAGTAALGNQVVGINIQNQGGHSVIGNVISGNTLLGVAMASIFPGTGDVQITDNKVGTDVSGKIAIPNGSDSAAGGGIALHSAGNLQVSGNLIAYHTYPNDFGLSVDGSTTLSSSQNNCLFGNANSLAAAPAAVVAFINNYWGSASGPTVGTDIIWTSPGLVVYSPFLTTAPAACAWMTPVAGLAPSGHDFESVAVGQTSDAFTFTLSNTGGAPLHVSDINTSGDFAVVGTPCTSAITSSCSIGVTFHPTASGARTGTLTVTSDGSAQPLTATLDGTGTESGGTPIAGLAPSGNDFGGVMVGQTSAAFTFTLSNTGNAPLHVSTISASSDEFAVVGTPCTGDITTSCDIEVTFTPTAGGARSGTLTVTSDGSAQPLTASLDGTGVFAGSPPRLKAPKDGAILLKNRVTLTWAKQKTASQYEVRLTNMADPANPVVTTIAGLTAPKAVVSLGYGVYQWQVRSLSAGGWSDLSAARAFEVTLLKTPRKGSVVKTLTPKFKWQSVRGASYLIEIYTDPADPDGSKVFDPQPAGKPTFTIPAALALQPATVYYWRVSIDGGGTWTPGWMFRTR